MEVLRDLADYRREGPGPVVTIGNFDGVHLGHQRLLGELVAEARARGTRCVLVTFEPHPAFLLAPERAAPLITSYEDKLATIGRLGLDTALVLPFTRALGQTDSESFVRAVFHEGLGACHLLVGPDTRFGRDRGGDEEQLRRLGDELGFTVSTVAPVQVEGQTVSSSAIRRLVLEGDVEGAARLLGRYHRLSGEVIRGHRRGRTLGFPTANLAPAGLLEPAPGVYATRLRLGTEIFPAVTSVGTNPTFPERQRSVETYVLDFSGDLYGQRVSVDFVARLREERRYASVAALVHQIEQDVVEARARLGARHGREPA